MLRRAVATLAEAPLVANVDDVLCVGQATAAHSALSAANEIITLRGLDLEESKTQAPPSSIFLLGFTPTLHGGCVAAGVTLVRLANPPPGTVLCDLPLHRALWTTLCGAHQKTEVPQGGQRELLTSRKAFG